MNNISIETYKLLYLLLLFSSIYLCACVYFGQEAISALYQSYQNYLKEEALLAELAREKKEAALREELEKEAKKDALFKSLLSSSSEEGTLTLTSVIKKEYTRYGYYTGDEYTVTVPHFNYTLTSSSITKKRFTLETPKKEELKELQKDFKSRLAPSEEGRRYPVLLETRSVTVRGQKYLYSAKITKINGFEADFELNCQGSRDLIDVLLKEELKGDSHVVLEAR